MLPYPSVVEDFFQRNPLFFFNNHEFFHQIYGVG